MHISSVPVPKWQPVSLPAGEPLESINLLGMPRICTQCHAEIATDSVADWCPACGGALIEREDAVAKAQPALLKAEIDHRGIVLPRRHASGGIITPQ